MCLNSTLHRSIETTPFRVMLGVEPRVRDDPHIRELLDGELVASFNGDRDELREQARKNIEKIQRENRKGYDRKRKRPLIYREGDLVAIERTQRGPGLKFSHKYLGPYEIIKVLRNHRYVIRKIGEHEGPMQTSSAADSMKPWIDDDDDDDVEDEVDAAVEEGENERSGRPLGQNGRV